MLGRSRSWSRQVGSGAAAFALAMVALVVLATPAVANASCHTPNAVRWSQILQAYRDILHREADQAEARNYLYSNLCIDQVRQSLHNFYEAQQLRARQQQEQQQQEQRREWIRQAYRNLFGQDPGAAILEGYVRSGLSLDEIWNRLVAERQRAEAQRQQQQQEQERQRQQQQQRPYQPQDEGALIKGSGDPVWLLQNGQRHYVPDPETLSSINNQNGGRYWSWSDSDVNRVPRGDDVPSRQQQQQQQQDGAAVQWARRLEMTRQAYRDILGREADGGGLENYARSGLSESDIRNSLLASDECRQGRGGQCRQQQQQQRPYQPQDEGALIKGSGDPVWLLQNGQRHYVPDPETLSSINNQNGGRYWSWSDSDVNRVPRGNDVPSRQQQQQQDGAADRRAQILQAYRDVLQREADQDGAEYYYRSNWTIDQIRQILCDSPEGQRVCSRQQQAPVQQSPSQDADRRSQILQAYRDILQREADQGGADFYYRSNWNIDQIRQILCDSPEGQRVCSRPGNGDQFAPLDNPKLRDGCGYLHSVCGDHPNDSDRTQHWGGIDLVAADGKTEGVPVRAWRGGTVRLAQYGGPGCGGTRALGWCVVIDDHTGEMSSIYGHLAGVAPPVGSGTSADLETNSIQVRPGQKVAAGTLIGIMGKSGERSGNSVHLHFGVRGRGDIAVDPLPFLSQYLPP